MPPLAAYTTFFTPVRTAQSNTFSVPITLMLASFAGSSSEGRTPDCAARWNTTSGRCRSNRAFSPSARTSMLKNVNSLP